MQPVVWVRKVMMVEMVGVMGMVEMMKAVSRL